MPEINDIEKRLDYFNGQFLEEDDFKDEQAYHVDRQRRHNRTLHTYGIADGLDVTPTDGTGVTVSPGTAIDGLGRQIVLPQESDPIYPTTDNTYLVISYDEAPSDEQNPPDPTNCTRIHERPKIELFEDLPSAETHIPLALIRISKSGGVKVYLECRIYAGPRLGSPLDEIVVKSIKLAANETTSNDWPEMIYDVPHRVRLLDHLALDGNLDVKGNIAVDGTVDGRDVSEDGIKLDYHVDSKDNPHDVNADQVDALSLSGGDVVGSVRVLSEIPLQPTLHSVLSGISLDGQRIGVYAYARHQYALYVDGTVYVKPYAANTYAIHVNGQSYFSGGKRGYVVDTFVNASGETLRTGDVVKLKGGPVVRFEGDDNRIPVSEVALADKENDTMVIGVVDAEAIPTPGSPDTRTLPENPTSIPDRGEVSVVTLGSIGHCHVDVQDAPIEVGDLLTSSDNPGHAKKATSPQIGSIIGKALEPLAEGTGYIAVFVNIQ